MLKPSTKCWISAFNAQVSRGSTVAVQVGAVKIYVNGGAQEKRKTRWKLRNNFDGFQSFIPPWNANVLFWRFFFNPTLCMTKLRVLVLSFPDFTDIPNITLAIVHGKRSRSHFTPKFQLSQNGVVTAYWECQLKDRNLLSIAKYLSWCRCFVLGGTYMILWQGLNYVATLNRRKTL